MPYPSTHALALCTTLCLCVSGCHRSPRTGRVQPLEWVDRDGEGELPLIVALHGRGDTPARFLEVFAELDAPARILSVRAPIDEGRGRGWFTFRLGFDIAMQDLADLIPRLRRTIELYRESHPTRGRPVMVGFSQGAMIVYAYASLHPGELSVAVPVSGGLAERFEPARGSGLPPIRAIHGSRDEVIEPTWSRDSVRRLRRLGADATYTEVPDAPHWMTRSMREAANRAILPALSGPG